MDSIFNFLELAEPDKRGVYSFAIPVQSVPLRMIIKEDEPWWIMKDVCDYLGIRDISSAPRVQSRHKGVHSMDTPGGPQDMIIINEYGLWRIIFRSDKPRAEQLTDYVIEILKQIRQKGYYSAGGEKRKITRWGWQPIREVMRQKGFTAKDLTHSANALDLPGIGSFNEGNFGAWSYGNCLPTESLIARAEMLLGVPREQLFTAEVLRSYKDRGPGRRRPKAVA
jgi:prophage antirepressor-like protein